MFEIYLAPAPQTGPYCSTFLAQCANSGVLILERDSVPVNPARFETRGASRKPPFNKGGGLATGAHLTCGKTKKMLPVPPGGAPYYAKRSLPRLRSSAQALRPLEKIAVKACPKAMLNGKVKQTAVRISLY